MSEEPEGSEFEKFFDDAWKSDNDAIADLAADALLRATDCHDVPFQAVEIHGTCARELIDFGRRHQWPPAEAFARQGRVYGVPFNERAWHGDPLYRAGWEAFRAIGAALAPLKLGLDPEPEPAEPRPQPRPGPGDNALERVGRHRIDYGFNTRRPAAKVARTPLSAVKGIGEKIEARLMEVGFEGVEHFAGCSPHERVAMIAKDEGLADLVERGDLIAKAHAHLDAAK